MIKSKGTKYVPPKKFISLSSRQPTIVNNMFVPIGESCFVVLSWIFILSG